MNDKPGAARVVIPTEELTLIQTSVREARELAHEGSRDLGRHVLTEGLRRIREMDGVPWKHALLREWAREILQFDADT